MRRVLLAIALMLVALMVDFSTAAAQQPGRVYRIGWLWMGEPDLHLTYEEFSGVSAALRDALRDGGYAVGKNLIVDVRDAQGDPSRHSALAGALVATQPDVLVTGKTAPTVAAMGVTKTVPIVFPGVGAPVERGIVRSLVNHGGKATGQAVNRSDPKLWQLLRGAAPTSKRLGWAPSLPPFPSNSRPTSSSS